MFKPKWFEPRYVVDNVWFNPNQAQADLVWAHKLICAPLLHVTSKQAARWGVFGSILVSLGNMGLVL